jgi:hypothetical protein
MRIHLSLLAFVFILFGCDKDDKPVTVEETPEFKNRSNAPSFVTIDGAFPDVKAYTLISSSDTIAASPGFLYGGAPDG